MADLAQLTTDVTDFLARTDWDYTKVRTFANLARVRLERIYRPRFLRVMTSNIAVSGNTFILPNDVGRIEQVTLHDGTTTRILTRRDESVVRQFAGTAAQAAIYYREQYSCTLAYSPNSGSTVDIAYRKKDVDLTNSTDTNSWSVSGYDVLFYMTCAVAAVYLRDADAAQAHGELAKATLEELRQDDIANEESDRQPAMSENIF